VDSVSVDSAGAATRRLTARRAVVLATGTGPLIPPIPGLREVGPWDNRAVTSAKELPGRLLVLGGGPVGVEMAQAYRRLGCADVVVVEGAGRLLAREEPFAGEELRDAFAAEGITVVTGARMIAARRQGGDGPVVVSLQDGREFTGDEYHARVAAAAILGREVTDVASHGIVPRVTFTDPQVCAVGPTEAEARDAGLNVTVVRTPTGHVAGAYTQGVDIGGTSQLIIDDASRAVVGATFTGPGVQELLHSATIAICAGAPIDRLWHAVPSFPTVSEVWLHLLEACGL
jgi:dihydrolipoamide dehydrogenase